MTMIVICILIFFIIYSVWGKDAAKLFVVLAAIFIVIGNIGACYNTEDVDENTITQYEQSLIDAKAEENKKPDDFDGKLPYDGMLVENFEYTKLGFPNAIVEQKGYIGHNTYSWYDKNGELLAECMADTSGRREGIVYGFAYYGDS